ncbi:MAG: hypothetical protein QOD29_3026 [Alphaproteobacteria bacterium]|nr:hypothetical protein [Alphaproteobacteria bacterium]
MPRASSKALATVFMRELIPEDLKFEVDKIGREEAMTAARYLAMVVDAGLLP